MQKKLLVFLCLILTFLIVNSQLESVYATTIFSDGFETNNFNAWTGTHVTSGDTLEVVATPVHHGDYAAHASCNANADDAYCYRTISDSTELFVRLYIRFPAADVLRNLAIWLKHGTTGVAYLSVVSPVGSNTYLRIVGTSGIYDSTTFTTAANIWYYVEIHIIISGTVGVLQGWFDGSLKVNKSNLNLGTDHVDRVYTGIGYAWEATEFYWDCVVVADAYIGPEATAESRSFTLPETFSFTDSLAQKQEQKQVLSEVFSYSDGMIMMQEQKYSLAETVTTTTVLSHGAEIPINFIEVFNSETLHITDTIKIWQEHRYIFPSTLTFNDSPIFQNFVLEIYIYINEVYAVAAIAFILAVTALALVLVYQRQKD